jgi:hypothetical protein
MSPKAKLAIFSAAVIVFLGFLLLLQLLRGESEIAVFVTGNAEGYLIPCGCRTSPAGGLSRRVTILDEIRSENPSRRVISVELPDLFMDRGPARDIINKTIGDFLARRDYLVSPGSQDLEFGNKLKEYYKQDCYLAGAEGCRDEYVVELGGYKFMPFGKKGRLHLLFLSEPGDLKGRKDPLTLYREKTKAASGDAFIVLGNLAPVTVQSLVQEKANLLAVVAAYGHTVTSTAQKADKTWAIFLGDKGRRYALFEIGYFDGRWQVWPKTEYINKEIAADSTEEDIVQKALLEVEKINKAELEKNRAPAGNFKGSLSCAKCHQKQYDIWKKSPHGNATEVLEIDHQENNPACLVCHSTGLGKGGYPNDNADFRGVGCETCHGAGIGHPPKTSSSLKEAGKKCTNCHTKRDSPGFNEESCLILIDHSARKTGK